MLKLLIILLPAPHRACLERLLVFAGKVAARAETKVSSPSADSGDAAEPQGGNKMTAMNIALVIGPNILREETKADAPNGPPTSKAAMQQAALQASKELADSQTVADVIRALIENEAELWTVLFYPLPFLLG